MVTKFGYANLVLSWLHSKLVNMVHDYDFFYDDDISSAYAYTCTF